MSARGGADAPRLDQAEPSAPGVIRLLHLADVHLDAPLGSFEAAAADRRAEVLAAFRRLPERAAEADVHAVLVAGDLFDLPQPSSEALAAVRETFRQLVEAGRPVFVVPGNHDAITLQPNPWRRDLAGAHVFREPTFGAPVRVETPSGLLWVYGVAHDPSRRPDPLPTFRRAPMEGAHVVLLHGAVPDAPHWGTSPNSLRLEPGALSGLQAEYVALGDYHAFRPPESFRPAGARACYAGSFAAVTFRESGPRGFAIAEVAAGERPRVRHVPSGVTPVEELGEVDITACEGPEAAADAVAERAPNGTLPVATLVGTPGFPLEMDEVADFLTERFPAFRLRDRTRYYAAARLDELAAEDTIVGHVVRLGRKRIARAVDRVGHAAQAEERGQPGGSDEPGASAEPGVSADSDVVEIERRALRSALRALEVR